MKQLFTALLCLVFSHIVHAEVRWNAKFQERYHSPADNNEIRFAVQTPPEIEGREAYPLIVVLNGGLRVGPGAEFPHFLAKPSRNRIWGYRTMSSFDVLQVIALMKQKYPIDPNRVYLVGSSAGASGAMHLASCYPHEFAAVIPLVASGNNYPLVNFSNLPVAFHHGDRDWVSAICNVRVQTEKMKALGCPVTLKEYAGVGHSVPGSHKPLISWLFEQRRDPVPHVIRHECEAPSLGKNYWLKIREFTDPHNKASFAANIDKTTIIIETNNISAFSLDTDLLSDLKTVKLGEVQLPISKHYRIRTGRWQVENAPAKPRVRTYEAGSTTNLYQGEPLLIVYGTAGERTNQLRATAAKLAMIGGPAHALMPKHRFPVKADKDLTDEEQSRANLILIGKPDENLVTKTIWSQLPVSLENRTLVAGERKPLSLDNQILGLFCHNPRHPDRLLYLLAPFVDDEDLARFRQHAHRFLPGSDGFDRISQPDLIVQDLDFRIARQMQFDKQWQWLKIRETEKPIPQRFSDRAQLALICMQQMIGKSQADFALWWGPNDRGMWGYDFNFLPRFNPKAYTLADFRTQHRSFETTLGSVTGAELKEIWNLWGRQNELISFPELDPASLKDETVYRLHIPMDLYIKLGRRKKNLRDPKPGPTFTMQELIPSIFSSPQQNKI